MNPRFPFNYGINPEYSSQPPPQNESQTFPQQFSYNPYNFNTQSQPFSQFSYNPFVYAGPSQIPNQEQSQSTSKSGKKTKALGRNKNWNMEEDEALCKAWLRVSEDAIVGTDQQRGRLWERIRVEFISILEYDPGRNASGLAHRWKIIQHCVSKFSGYVRTIERAQRSGNNAEDNMIASKQLYNDKEEHQFKYDSCWMILKDTSKWYNYTIEQKGKQKKTSQKKRVEIDLDDDEIEDSSNTQPPSSDQSAPATTPTSTGHEIDDGVSNDGAHGLPRHHGRKTAKNARRKKNLDSIDLFVEEFSNMRKEQSSRFEEEGIRRNAIEQQKLQAKIETKRMEIAAKQEHQQKQREQEIMLMDPQSAPTEEGKAWIIEQQIEILSRIRKNKN
ncbi:PREDICTED: uncharacterized protein LOC105978146 [Erythranthe guttata]|uniref:uncharacterized protein LOC105978146 n=1 Tax=Erythranthe guttata TaxID=4155 RepID=UPI00064E0289|nr:PREDICTED: uncharacterized protein LOC105978146 [Erythranthe guttata]|eukprot:XP_012859018.1 PREDICTED: uncharacterized protein LOC105978146 [Erythranthe guttata]